MFTLVCWITWLKSKKNKTVWRRVVHTIEKHNDHDITSSWSLPRHSRILEWLWFTLVRGGCWWRLTWLYHLHLKVTSNLNRFILVSHLHSNEAHRNLQCGCFSASHTFERSLFCTRCRSASLSCLIILTIKLESPDLIDGLLSALCGWVFSPYTHSPETLKLDCQIAAILSFYLFIFQSLHRVPRSPRTMTSTRVKLTLWLYVVIESLEILRSHAS